MVELGVQGATPPRTVKLAAKKDGTLTAMQMHTVSDTGAYGNHAGEIIASSLGSCLATYRCANKKGTGYAVYTNTVPSGAFRGYGAGQPTFLNSEIPDDLSALIMDLLEKEPDNRPASAAAVVQRFVEIEHPKPAAISAPEAKAKGKSKSTAKPKKTTMLWPIVAIVGGLVLISAGVVVAAVLLLR